MSSAFDAVDGHARRALEGLGVLDKIPRAHRFATRKEAIVEALSILSDISES